MLTSNAFNLVTLRYRIFCSRLIVAVIFLVSTFVRLFMPSRRTARH